MIWLGITSLGALGIVWSDFRERSVHLWWYFILLGGLVGLGLRLNLVGDLVLFTAINFLFVSLLLLLLTLYFSFKEKRILSIFDNYIGWGDVLFFFVIAVYFTLEEYIMFTIGSILIALVMTPLLFKLQGKERHIPLAGIQACCLLIYVLLSYFGLFAMPRLNEINL